MGTLIIDKQGDRSPSHMNKKKSRHIDISHSYHTLLLHQSEVHIEQMVSYEITFGSYSIIRLTLSNLECPI